jgi:hypothetical protein
VQFAPAARLVPQLFPNPNAEAFVPVTAMLVIDSGPAPVLVIVTDCDALEVPTVWLPNDRLVADKDTTGAPTPVPLSAIDCGESVALSMIVIAAVRAPVVVGPKCPWMVQLAPAARLVPQLLPKENEETSVPVTAMLVIDRLVVPEFVMVTDCDALVVPTSWVPKEMLVLENVTCAAAKEGINMQIIASKDAGITRLELLMKPLPQSNMTCSLSV